LNFLQVKKKKGEGESTVFLFLFLLSNKGRKNLQCVPGGEDWENQPRSGVKPGPDSEFSAVLDWEGQILRK